MELAGNFQHVCYTLAQTRPYIIVPKFPAFYITQQRAADITMEVALNVVMTAGALQKEPYCIS